MQPLKASIVSFINVEGNLTLKDTGLTKTVAEYSFDEFRDDKYAQIKDELKHSQEPSAAARSKWLEVIPDYAFYKTSVSLVDWTKSGKLLSFFANASCKKAYMLGDKNTFKKDIIPQDIETIVIPNAGHFMLLDNPKACFSAIDTFVTKAA